MMTSDAFVLQFRDEVADTFAVEHTGADALWSDSEIYEYLNEAAETLASETQGVFSEFTLPVEADEPFVRLPANRVLDIELAKLVTAKTVLRERNIQRRAAYNDYGIRSTFNWEDSTGTPREFTLGMRPGYLRLIPIPTEADSLYINATVMPPEVYPGAPLPYQERKDRRLLLHYMKFLAYGKHDADAFNPELRDEFYGYFVEGAKARKSELNRRRRTPGVVRFSW